MKYIKKHVLNLDYETFSDVDIKLGVHKYTTGSEIILAGFSFDGQPVTCYDVLCGEDIPDDVANALLDANVIKKAWNAAFEIEQTEKHLGEKMALSQWRCTMIKSARCGYPLSLEDAGKAMKLDVEKDKLGKSLIRTFSVPRKPTKSNPARRIMPWDEPEKWDQFKKYCIRDVEVEMAIDGYLSQFPEQPHFEDLMYLLDRQINKRGVGLDLPFIKKVIALDTEYKERLTEEAREKTGLENPNSVSQLKGWLEAHTGRLWGSLNKETLADALERGKLPDGLVEEYEEDGQAKTAIYIAEPSAPEGGIPEHVVDVLELRKELSNTSVKKYITMLNANVSGRIYDTIQFNGAARTGRNAGRLIQPQNLPRIYMENDELDTARSLAALGDLDILEMCYDSVSSVLSQLIRTALVAREGKIFKVADLSAIEARVLAWLAGEEKVLEVFRTHGKIYEATAAMMFNVPLESVTKGSEMRQRGKTASLACGYQGGANAITTMDTDKKIPDEVKPGLVKAWRAAHPNIVRFWYRSQDCAIKALQNPGQKVPLSKGAYFITHRNALLFYLPSGRYLMYPEAYIAEGQYGPQVRFMGADQTTGKWTRQSTYGGKLVENLVQAVARDVLMVGMYNLVRAGYDIVFSVHDEIVTEMDHDKGSLEEIENLMCKMPEWADGLPLAAEGFESHYYRK